MGLRRVLVVLLLATAALSGLAVGTEPRAPAGLPPDKSVIDMHTHVAGLGQGCAACFVSPALTASYKFDWYLRAFGTTAEEMRTSGDRVVAAQLLSRVRASRWVKQSVVLAMDGVVDAQGQLDRERTQIYVPNDYVRELAATHAEFLFGASINPYRVDALARLEQVARDGAVLIKWIPAIMHIDPGDPALDPFYRLAARLGMPLLIHVGDENAFHHADNAFGDPVRLRRPLDLGVTVIAAHIATTGENGGEDNFERLLGMFSDYPNLYTDISSLTQMNKLGYLVRALKSDSVKQRMIYGSDWPLQFFPLVWAGWHVGRAPLAELRYAARLPNVFDRDIALKAALAVPPDVLARTGEVLHSRH